MEEVETAAADTTSEHSFSIPGPSQRSHGHTHGDAHSYERVHMTTPNYHVATNFQSYHDDVDHHQTSWRGSLDPQLTQGNEQDKITTRRIGQPASKRLRTDSYSVQNLQMSPKTSVHVRRHHGDRPVGIAQPIQLQDTQLQHHTEPLSDTEQTELDKHTSSHSSKKQQHTCSSIDSSLSSTSQVKEETQTVEKSRHSMFGDYHHGTTAFQDFVTPLDVKSSVHYFDDVYDSDQSQDVQRFDKFINESNKSSISCSEPTEGPFAIETRLESSQESTTSEASSESTGRFLAMYANPDMQTMESANAYIHSSTAQSNVQFQDSPPHQAGFDGIGQLGTSSEPLSGLGQQDIHRSRHEGECVQERRRNPPVQIQSPQDLKGTVCVCVEYVCQIC